MKRVMILMTVFMGLIMSLVLSLVGTLMGGHFTVPSWLISFAISFAISLIIGFIVPIKKICDAFSKKLGANPDSLKGNLLGGIISDLIYTPVITISMVCIMVTNAVKHLPENVPAEQIPTIGKVLPGSLIVSLLVGYVIIIIIQPLLLKLFIPKGAGPKPQ